MGARIKRGKGSPTTCRDPARGVGGVGSDGGNEVSLWRGTSETQGGGSLAMNHYRCQLPYIQSKGTGATLVGHVAPCSLG